MTQNLVIVESPAKSRTVERLLQSSSRTANENSDRFEIFATGGHVYELQSKDGQVDVDNDFRMKYRINPEKSKYVKPIVDAMCKSDALYLATDPDREGEAISAHIKDILEKRGVLKNKPVHRIVFHEVTSDALKEAIEHPREVSEELVQAQQTRAALDYLVGFNLSPLLWFKLSPGLSAGRVQSPALRLIVERQREINRFVPQEFWTIDAELNADKPFTAQLIQFNGKKVEKTSLQSETEAAHAVAEITKSLQISGEGKNLVVSEVNAKTRTRRPLAPFTTSTMMQDGNRNLGMSAKVLMRTAQELYEGLTVENGQHVGLITYMRTDSVTLSTDAISQIRKYISTSMSAGHMPSEPIQYKTKSKNAQEAHEAIRPTNISKTPEKLKPYLNKNQWKLYELIWRRTVASQMKGAVYNQITADLATGNHLFRATGSTLEYPGYLLVYKDTLADKKEDTILPPLKQGQKVPVKQLKPEQHFTQPPPRYNQASLVKTLEENGIGRPSTYLMIISKLLDRNYVYMESRSFIATDRGCAVNDFLTDHFQTYVDYDFTAKLEEDLDEIARGNKKRIEMLNGFWSELKHKVEEGKTNLPRFEKHLGTDPKTGKEVILRFKKDNYFIQIGRQSEDGDKPTFLRITSEKDPTMLNENDIKEMLEAPGLPRTLGTSPEGYEVTVKDGRFGPYIAVVKNERKPFNVSIGEDLDPMTLTLDQAVKLIKQKEHEDANRVIKKFESGVQILNGRFGPYVTDGKTNASIPKDRDPKVLEIDECMKLIEAKANAPKRRNFRSNANSRRAPSG